MATESDAEGILKAHYSAVHQTAAKDYPQEVLDEWSIPVTEERIAYYLKHSFPSELTMVAEIKGEIAGFGAIVPSENELRAVYVAPKWTGMGVGKALLVELEKMAIQKGVTTLSMDSSVTAWPFYQANGYQVISHGEHSLRSGRKMACVKMKKIMR